jgi:phage terminase large subunit-like protein
MASNVTVEQDAAGNLKPSKRKSSEKIDGIVALVMAIGRAQVQDQKVGVYESRGIVNI